MNNNFDDALEQVGIHGNFQKLLLFGTFLYGIPSAFTTLITVFTHYTPKHHCHQESPNVSSKGFSLNKQIIIRLFISKQISAEKWLNISIPIEKDYLGNLVHSSCKIYENGSNLRQINCPNGWEYYDYKQGFSSVTTEV